MLNFCFFRYADTLIQQRGETLAKGQEFLTWNDVQKCIDTVNIQVHEEHERKMTFLGNLLGCFWFNLRLMKFDIVIFKNEYAFCCRSHCHSGN